MTIPARRRRFLPLAAVALAGTALLLPPAAERAAAQNANPTLQRPFAIGGTRARSKPYSFTGRVFDNANISFGSGTLIRRHTVLTAAHVIFDEATGFSTSTTFDRALNGSQRLSISRALSLAVLSGYQEVAGLGVNPANESRDLGYLALIQPSVDEDFAPFARQPAPTFKNNSLTDPSVGRFVLGYPGVTFNGRTMAYIVPLSPYVEAAGGYYQNFDYVAEPGMSGGPVYAVINGVQTVVGETTDGLTDPSGTFNYSGIRAIDKEADRFLVSAEYTNGLIAGVVIAPTDTTSFPVNALTNTITVARGSVVNFNTRVVFNTPTASGARASTTRYTELTLTSDFAANVTSGANPTPLVAITKTGNNQFQVAFNSALRTGSVVTLQAQYAKNTNAPTAPVPTNTAPGVTPVSPAPSTLTVVVR